jgi:AbrB family looped-hinge helix DNA binding protein
MTEMVELSVDEKGHIQIPAALQSRLGLKPGTSLLVEEGENGGIRLRQQLAEATLTDKEGILVVQAQPLEDLTSAVRRTRDPRTSALSRAGEP